MTGGKQAIKTDANVWHKLAARRAPWNISFPQGEALVPPPPLEHPLCRPTFRPVSPPSVAHAAHVLHAVHADVPAVARPVEHRVQGNLQISRTNEAARDGRVGGEAAAVGLLGRPHQHQRYGSGMTRDNLRGQPREVLLSDPSCATMPTGGIL